jgi:hypothetical protein
MEGWSDYQKKSLQRRVYHGQVDSRNLPKDLYEVYGKSFKEKVNQGLGEYMLNFQKGTPEANLVNSLEDSTWIFSAAKTFQEIKELEDLKTNENGVLRPYEEFESLADSVQKRYEEDWQDAEESTTQGMSAMAEKWVQIENDKTALPYLQYVLTEETSCDICPPLDNVILPVDDPFWDEYAPLNHFNCACLLNQLDSDFKEYDSGVDGDVLTPVEREAIKVHPDKGFDFDSKKQNLPSYMENKIKVTSPKKIEDIKKILEPIVNPVFKTNPAKTGMIFNKYHPYFKIEEKDRKFAKTNFGLKIPKK